MKQEMKKLSKLPLWAGGLCTGISALVWLQLLLDSRPIENRWIAGKLVDFLIRSNLTGTLLVREDWLNKVHLWGILGIGLSVLLLIIAAKSGAKHRIVCILLCLLVVAFNGLLSLHLIVSGYIHKAFALESGAHAYQEHYGDLEKSLGSSASAAELTLHKLMQDVQSKDVDLNRLSDNDYVDLALSVSLLVDEQGGVKTKAQHYFRNEFGRAPQTLDQMVAAIRGGEDDAFHWQLLRPDQTYLHMMGPDGAFNLKFVSEDGHFEAVYNKEGQLLGTDNNPVDMGTFNYASPLDSLGKHARYDVATYYKWGNVPGEKAVPKDEMSAMADKFKADKEAAAHYEEVKKQLGQ